VDWFEVRSERSLDVLRYLHSPECRATKPELEYSQKGGLTVPKRILIIAAPLAVLTVLAMLFLPIGGSSGPNPVTTALNQMFAAAKADTSNHTLLKTLERNADAFESRAHDQGLSSVQQVDTFIDVDHLLAAHTALINKTQRIKVAEEIISQAANPYIISQGEHNTCTVTTLEERTFTLLPSEAAGLIVSASLYGHWTAPDGEYITLKASSFLPGPEESQYPVPALDRSYASEIFQVVVIDGLGLLPNPPVYTGTPQPQNPPVYFEQLQPQLAIGDTGEYWVNKQGHVVGIFAGLSNADIVTAAHVLFNLDTGFIIGNAGLNDPITINRVSSASQLSAILQRFSTANELPAVLLVRGDDPIFGNGDVTSGEPVDHVVIIAKVQGGRAYVVNPWGKTFDRWISINKLYNSTINEA